MSGPDKQPLLTKPEPRAQQQQAVESMRKSVDSAIRDAIIEVHDSAPPPKELVETVQQARSQRKTPSIAGTSTTASAASTRGAPNFISAVIPLFGIIAAATLCAFLLGRWYFSILWTMFIMYGVWEIVRRRVERFEAYHRNRIDREIAKEKLEYHMETCEWINHIVDRFWAVLEPVVSSQVIDKTNQELARQCPKFLDSLELTEFTLGSSAPHVLGAKVYPQTGSDVIHLDMDVCFVPNEIVEHDFLPKTKRGPTRWNSKIVLNARIGRGMVGMDIPVMIREILFYGRFRAQIQLAANIPFVQKIDFGFLEPPKIDFILRPLKSVDIMDLPGLSQFLFSMINTNVAKQLVNPNKITIDLVEIMKSKKKTRMNSVGVLRVKVLQIRGLKDTEDSTVRMAIAGRLKAETVKLEKGEDVWNEVHYILIPSTSYPITFSLMGPTSLISSSTDMIGVCKVSVDEVSTVEHKDKYMNVWKRVATRSSSKAAPELNLGVEYFPAQYIDEDKEGGGEGGGGGVEGDAGRAKKATPETTNAAEKSKLFKSGILQITLHGAKDLPAHPAKKDWTTFMEASVSNCLAEDAAKRRVEDDINPYKFKSTIKKKSNSPSWEETFEFLIVNCERDEITMRLRDAKDDYPLGNITCKVKDLLDMSDWFSLKGTESGKVYLSTIFKPVDIRIDDPSALKYAPAIGVLKVNIIEGVDFKVRNGDYYVDLCLNGRSLRKTRTIKATTENPGWQESLTVFLKAESDLVLLKLYEENNLLKDSGEGVVKLDLKPLFASPGKSQTFSQVLVRPEKEGSAEKLKYEVVYYPVGTLKLEEAIQENSLIDNGQIQEDEASNSGVLEVRSVALFGMSDKIAGKLKLNCAISLSSSPESSTTTKTVRAKGKDNKFQWELFSELFVVDYQKTSLWLVFSDESGLLGDWEVVCSVSIPVSLLASGKAFPVPNMPDCRVSMEGRYRGISAGGPLQCPVLNFGLMKIDIIRATVMAVDSGGTSDPYVTVKLNGRSVFKTKEIKKTLTPEWKTSCQVKIEDRRSDKLLFEVTDWNQVMMNQPLGKVGIDLLKVVPDKDIPLECKLQGVPTGTLWINLHYETHASKSAANQITTVPEIKEKSEIKLIGTAAGTVTGATGIVTGAAGTVAGHTADAAKAVSHGVTSTASAMKSGVTSVFGLQSKKDQPSPASSGQSRLENDLKFTIKAMTGSPEMEPFDSAISVMIDGRERLYRTKVIKHSVSPDWEESFEVTAKQLKHSRFLEFFPDTNLGMEALKLNEGDKPVFRLDLGRPELAAEEGNTFTLFLNDREDDPPLTLNITVHPIAGKQSQGLGKMFGKIKFGK